MVPCAVKPKRFIVPDTHYANSPAVLLYFSEHITYADSSVCFYSSTFFNVCLMHGQIPQQCMKTIIAPICKIRMMT